jgi:hypothetical protein
MAHEGRGPGLLREQGVPRDGVQFVGMGMDPDVIIRRVFSSSAMSSPVTLSVALAQINATVGDLAGNARLIAQAAREAHAQGAQLVLAPELALTGYPPEDLLLRPAFMAACARTLRELAAELSDCAGLHVVVGHPQDWDAQDDLRSKSYSLPRRFNAASVLAGGRCWPPTASASCPTTRCSTSGAISPPGGMPVAVRSSSRWAGCVAAC